VTRTELLLEVNVFAATAVIVCLGGWPRWTAEPYIA
jgi:hypothetical protein